MIQAFWGDSLTITTFWGNQLGGEKVAISYRDPMGWEQKQHMSSNQNPQMTFH